MSVSVGIGPLLSTTFELKLEVVHRHGLHLGLHPGQRNSNSFTRGADRLTIRVTANLVRVVLSSATISITSC